MNHELQPQTQLAEATPQMQPESQGFLQNVLARGRYALAIGGSALLAGGVGAYKSHEAEAATSGPDFPPITQVIDGEEPQWAGNIMNEQNYADDCKRKGPEWVLYGEKFSRTANRFILKTNYTVDSFQQCNNYGRLTRKYRIDTRAPGARSFIAGNMYTIQDHRGASRRQFTRIGQKCPPDKSLTARLWQKEIYQHLDGSTTVKTYRHRPQVVACR